MGLINHPVGWYMAGILSAIVAYICWSLLRVYRVSRSTIREAEVSLGPEPTSPAEQQARSYVKACQKRLLLQTKLNPDWTKPLKDELPQLVQGIAKTFYPEESDPLLAPGISEFVRAVELASNDIATFLQTSRHGRLLDVSASTAQKTYNVTRRVIGDRRFRLMLRWYKRVRPIVQVIKYKSLVMWMFFLGRNSAVRALQVTIAGIVGKWAILLYSGKLAKE